MNLVDTDVLIEAARGHGAGTEWLASMKSVAIGVPGVVAMEFIAGSGDARMLKQSIGFLESLTVVRTEPADDEPAFELLAKYRLKTGLSLPDFIVAAQAMNRDATLYSFNLKHFGAIDSLTSRAPFER